MIPIDVNTMIERLESQTANGFYKWNVYKLQTTKWLQSRVSMPKRKYNGFRCSHDMEEKEQTFFDKSAEQMKPISLSSVWTSQRARIQIKYTHLRNRNVWQWNKNWLSATKRGDEGEKNDRQMWRERKTNGWYNEKNVQRIDSEIEQIKSEEWKVRNESARNNMRCSDWCAIFFSAGASASRW